MNKDLTDGEAAAMYRFAADYLVSEGYPDAARTLRQWAELLDPPYKVDRSLRGWVLVGDSNRGMQHVQWASRRGISQFKGGSGVTWDYFERDGCVIRRLTCEDLQNLDKE